MKHNQKKPELLAPAGSIASMKAAINAGADAIYIGGPLFGARAFAENPDEKGLIEAIDFCHFHNRKIYLTVNTLLKEDELNAKLYDFIRPLYEEGLDAVLVQDYGVLSFIRDKFPGLPIHASTQMAVSGYYGARLLRELGVERLVLPREASLSDLKGIISRGDNIETEVFVHGALCYCFSGQCLMSSLIGGRSGNRGKCAQVCRLPFSSGSSKKLGQMEHLLNLKDLNTLSILPDIIDTGVTSLKIEGRMKSPRYTAGVTSIYRKYIDKYFELKGREKTEEGFVAKDNYKVATKDVKILKELFDRGGTTTGYLTKHNGKDMIFKGEKPELRTPDETLLSKIDEAFLANDIKEPVTAKVVIRAGEPATMELSDGKYKGMAVGEIVSKAKTKPLSFDEIKERLSKFGNTGFELTGIELKVSDDAFMPVSSLNALRREAAQKLAKEKINGYKRTNF